MPDKKTASLFQVMILFVIALILPLILWQSMSWVPNVVGPKDIYESGSAFPETTLPFRSMELSPQEHGLPLITNVQIVNLDDDEQNEILICDAALNRISMGDCSATGEWSEEMLINDVAVPAHATAVDIDQDGDLDIIVSILGNIYPDDEVIGRVELFENRPEGYRRHVILDDVRRVADVQPGDFDGDGDLDLAVAVFGYARGSVLWLENRGDFQFLDHLLLNAPGTIHVPVADYDLDGDLDITAIVTQHEEELWAFENLGDGTFQERLIWFTVNMDLGSAGLVSADLDQDGDEDLILPAGDNLEDKDAYPQPYHGCYWFENQGDWKFVEKRIADLGGTYAADVGDLDADGDMDIALVSMSNYWYNPDNASVVWLENDGQENFTTWQIAQNPIHLVTVAVGDLNQDGREDIVAGSLNLRKPYQRMGKVNLWLNQGGQ